MEPFPILVFFDISKKKKKKHELQDYQSAVYTGSLTPLQFHVRLFQVRVLWQCSTIISVFCFNRPQSCNYDLSAVI